MNYQKMLFVLAALGLVSSCAPRNKHKSLTMAEFCVDSTVKDAMSKYKIDASTFDKIKDQALTTCQSNLSSCSPSMFGRLAHYYSDSSESFERERNFTDDDNKCYSESTKWEQNLRMLAHRRSKAEYCTEETVTRVMKRNHLDLATFAALKDEALDSCRKTFSTCSELMFGFLTVGGTYDADDNNTKCASDSQAFENFVGKLSRRRNKAQFCVEETIENFMQLRQMDMSKFPKIKAQALSDCQSKFTSCSEIMFGEMARFYKFGYSFSYESSDQACISDSQAWRAGVESLVHATP